MAQITIGAGGDIATGGGKVFVAADSRIIVADQRGAITGEIAGMSGAVGLAMTTDGTRLYAALRDSHQVVAIDTATLNVTRSFDLGANSCPANLALSGDRLWVGYGCGGSGGALVLDTSEAAPVPVRIRTGFHGSPRVAVAADTLVVGDVGISNADLLVYDINADPATLRGEIPSNGSYLRDLAITSDGSTVVTAFEDRFVFDAWSTRSLAKVRTYGADEAPLQYPVSVAISPDGAHIAGAIAPTFRNQIGPDIGLYETESGSKVYANDHSIGWVAINSLAFSGNDLFAVLTGYNGTYLWRMEGVLLPASTLNVDAPSGGTALDPLRLTGRLNVTDGSEPGPQTLTVTRQLPDGTSATLADATTAEDGTFEITDAPPIGGQIKYGVTWDGDSGHRWSTASVTVAVTKRQASLSLSGPQSSVAGKKIQLNGMLDAGGPAVPSGTRLTVVRTVTAQDGTQVTSQLEPEAVAGDGSFSFADVPEHRGQYTYSISLSDGTFLPAQTSHDVAVRGAQG